MFHQFLQRSSFSLALHISWSRECLERMGIVQSKDGVSHFLPPREPLLKKENLKRKRIHLDHDGDSEGAPITTATLRLLDIKNQLDEVGRNRAIVRQDDFYESLNAKLDTFFKFVHFDPSRSPPHQLIFQKSSLLLFFFSLFFYYFFCFIFTSFLANLCW